MPLRAATLINWLCFRGHVVTVLYDIDICNVNMEGSHYLDRARIINRIDDFNEYDMWFADLLNYKNYHLMSAYNEKIKKFEGTFCVISFDDGSDFFDHRLDEHAHQKVACWLNNLIEKDLEKYHKDIRSKNMLLPTYIEASNENYDIFCNIHKGVIKPFEEKESRFYFSGAVTGCIPAIECRINSILHLVRSDLPYNVRVTGTDPSPFLQYLYDNYINVDLKNPLIDLSLFLHELNDHKFLLSPKGNCQPLRRQYEGYAFNNLVFINENNTVNYLFSGIADENYVSYKLDCSDLKDKMRYYMNNLDKAKTIADNGNKYWKDNCIVYMNGDISPSVTRYLLENFKEITGVDL